MEKNKSTLKYHADWKQPLGKTTKKGERVHIHPYDLIAFVHKKKGIDEASVLARRLITIKYNHLLERSKIKSLPPYMPE